MAHSDEHRSVFAYVVGAALGAVALGVTAWVGLRGRENGRFGIPRRRGETSDAEGAPDTTVDEDLV